MRLKAIIFDVDGTIIPLKVATKNFQVTCRHFGIKAPTAKELMKNAIGFRIFEVLPKLIPDAVPIKDEFRKYFEENQIKNFKKYGKLLPHVKSTFDLIHKRGIKIGIVTTKKRNEALAVLNGYKLNYNVLVGGDEVRNRKPHPEPVLKACENLEVDARHCMFVGDHPFDMIAAKSASCLATGVLTGWGNRKSLKEAGADYIIKNLKDLIKLIE